MAGTAKVHEYYYDALRIIAIILVIVNHTLGSFYLSLDGQCADWWIASIGFFACKIAVPLFVMLSGALLLGRQDSYSKAGSRIARIALALILFSLLFYLSFPKNGPSLQGFIDGFLNNSISAKGMYWYLYMYLGLLIMLPILQKLESVMDRKDYHYFFAVTYGFVCLWPVLVEFFPSLKLTPWFQMPLFSSFIGMMFIGRYLSEMVECNRRGMAVAAVVFAISLIFLCFGTWYFYYQTAGVDYLKLDNRSFTPIVAMAASIFYLVRCLFGSSRVKARLKGFASSALNELARCSFGMYLVHGWFLLWIPLLLEPVLLQGWVWLITYQLLVIVCSFIVALLLRRLPILNKIM